MEMYIQDLQIKRQRLEMDEQYSDSETREPRNARDRTQIALTDGRTQVALTDDHKSEDYGFSTDYDSRRQVDNSQNYHSSQLHVSNQTSHFSASDGYHATSYNSDTSINNSYLHTHHPQRVVSSETLSPNPILSSSTLHEDSIKEDNTVISLKRERSEMESQICDMRIQLTRLQAEVTSLENRKTILETVHRDYASDDLKVGLTNGYGVGIDTDLDYNIATSITEVTEVILTTVLGTFLTSVFS